MEDLDDDMLTQILLRLPSCATVTACSPVNKRWCSLISHPNFPDQFTNHKKKTTTLLKGSGFDNHQDDEPPWTFVTTFTEFIFESPKLSLEYFPISNCTIIDTFKDLALCVNYSTDQVVGRVYYITNPLTRQWVVLPPLTYPMKPIRSTVLICQPPHKHTQDYKFRVVEIIHPYEYHSPESAGTFDLFVYCSEIGEWKEIKLRVPKESAGLLMRNTEFKHVVCNGIVYFNNLLCLVALDPFDVNDTCDTTLEVRVMPPLPDLGCLIESSGQLLVVKKDSGRCLWYKTDPMAIELEMKVWKLDPNQAPLVWETTFQGLCKGTMNSIELRGDDGLEGHVVGVYPNYIGIHPYNDKLIYMYLALDKQLFLCDTRTGCITALKSLSGYSWRFHRLEQKWWPTSVPRQCLAVEHKLLKFK